jgi:LPXTG-motif cell wall-anchored protein
MDMIKRVLILAFGVGAFVAACAGAAPTASATCVAPTLQLSSLSVRPGDQLVVNGSGFFTGPCNDTIVIPTSTTIPDVPTAGIQIVFIQGSREALLTTLNANADFRFSTTVQIPPDAGRGAAAIVARIAGRDPVGDYDHVAIVVSTNPARPVELARTGGRGDNALVVTGVVLLALGLALTSRRRARHEVEAR